MNNYHIVQKSCYCSMLSTASKNRTEGKKRLLEEVIRRSGLVAEDVCSKDGKRRNFG